MLAATFALACALVATPQVAAAASRLESIPLPSNGNVDLTQNRLNRISGLTATVLLPDGYDAQPGKPWPVLYLLHGAEDNATTWSQAKFGDIQNLAAKLPAIVVMPEGGRSYFTDQWLGGKRTVGNWERYFLDEVIPTIDARYRVLPGRANHAIGGISMGGYGAVLFAAQLPTYFGSVVSLSGLLDLTNPITEYALPGASHVSYARMWGPFNGPYVQAHNPMSLLGNLTQTRIYVSTGNGVPDLTLGTKVVPLVEGSVIEANELNSSKLFTSRARAAGVPVTLSVQNGSHDWPYWRRQMPKVFAWNPFATVPSDATPSSDIDFTHKTMALSGNAWGVGYTFAAPPLKVAVFSRTGRVLTATGSGTVTIASGAADDDASGAGLPACTFTATLPFTRTLAAGC